MISIILTEKTIFLKMPKKEEDLQFVRTIRFVRWNKENFLWEIPNYPGNLQKIKGHFGTRIEQITDHQDYSPEAKASKIPEKTSLKSTLTPNISWSISGTKST